MSKKSSKKSSKKKSWYKKIVDDYPGVLGKGDRIGPNGKGGNDYRCVGFKILIDTMTVRELGLYNC